MIFMSSRVETLRFEIYKIVWSASARCSVAIRIKKLRNTLRQPMKVTREMAGGKADMPPCFRLVQHNSRTAFTGLRQGIHRDKGVVACVEDQGRDTNILEQGARRALAPIIMSIDIAVHRSGV